MKEEKITNEDLAMMIKNDVVDKMATKDDLKDLKSEMNTRFEKVDERFDKIDEDLREINMKVHDIDEYSRRHSRRIEKLEENAGIL